MIISQIGSHNPQVNIVKITCSAWFGPEATKTVGGSITSLVASGGAAAFLWAVQRCHPGTVSPEHLMGPGTNQRDWPCHST